MAALNGKVSGAAGEAFAPAAVTAIAEQAGEWLGKLRCGVCGTGEESGGSGESQRGELNGELQWRARRRGRSGGAAPASR